MGLFVLFTIEDGETQFAAMVLLNNGHHEKGIIEFESKIHKEIDRGQF